MFSSPEALEVIRIPTEDLVLVKRYSTLEDVVVQLRPFSPFAPIHMVYDQNVWIVFSVN
jgi:hypothetical protein